MMISESIRQLQQMLNATLQPSPNLVADGLMGPRTRAALGRYNAAKSAMGGDGNGRLMSVNGAQSGPSTDNASAKWMAIAEAEQGTAEIPGSASNARIIAYHATTSLAAQSDDVAWCSAFVNWVMRQAGLPGTNSAAARSWLSWPGGTACEPRYGAITVIRNRNAGRDEATGSPSGYHVGFFSEFRGNYIRLLGGNQSKQHVVNLMGFNRNSYEPCGYRWPS